jgi:RHS repeat-associated protein
MTVKWAAPSGATRRFDFLWDALGRRRQISYPNGMTVSYRYDKLGVLRRLNATGQNNLGPKYHVDSVDALGRIMYARAETCNEQVGSFCESFTTPAIAHNTWQNRYNRLGMALVQRNGADTDSLRYDAAGNIVRRKVSVITAGPWKTFGIEASTNRLLTMSRTDGVPPMTYSHDANGARLLETGGGSEFSSQGYYYDRAGRITGMQYYVTIGQYQALHDNADSCRYDADGQMIVACGNYSPYMFYDGANVVGIRLDARWTIAQGPGLDDPLIGIVRNTCPGDLCSSHRELYWITDGNGRQFGVGLETGSPNTGKILPDMQFGSTGVNGWLGWQFVGGSSRSFGFGSSRQSPEGSSFSVFRNRLYDQSTGRWTQEDPIGVAGGINLYQFNGNNPASYTDPFGLCPPIESCILLGELAASGQKALTIKTFEPGEKRTVRGFEVTAKRPTSVTVSKSETTGNAVVSIVGQVSVEIPGPNIEVTAGSVDLGTGEAEAHGHYGIPLGRILVPLHAKGNKEQGVTGVCVLLCVPISPKEGAGTP